MFLDFRFWLQGFRVSRFRGSGFRASVLGVFGRVWVYSFFPLLGFGFLGPLRHSRRDATRSPPLVPSTMATRDSLPGKGRDAFPPSEAHRALLRGKAQTH